jgi:hypothetical protein
MCSKIRRTLSNKARRETQITFYKSMVVPLLTYESEIWTAAKNKNKKYNSIKEAKTETAELKYLSVAGYTRKEQTGNTKIRKELNLLM